MPGSFRRPKDSGRLKDPAARMSLAEHIAEFRRRLLWSALAIGLAAVAGWFLYPWLFEATQEPLLRISREHGIRANINYGDVMQAFNLHLKIATYLGVVIASPVWLYQLWAFIMPGLTKREKRYALAFSAAGTPLFLTGIWLGWLVLPNAVGFFTSFAEPGTSVLPDAGEYLGFVTRLVLVFGLAFLLPLILVALNLAGILSAAVMARGWRLAVFLVFLFAALASPSPEVGSMLALAFPMVGLYLLAVGVAWLHDRRLAARRAQEATHDDVADPIAAPTSITQEPNSEPADDKADVAIANDADIATDADDEPTDGESGRP